MPKIKTLKTAAKRFKKTATGEFKRGHAFATHYKIAKSGNRRRKLRHSAMVAKADTPKLKRMIPY
ncbi:MAG: 50S ribosomal protein L35 [candidate division Zixibacteria bacterium]|nr:50S ribosomal protein L35 [candidate division Zixibacteria bacterium]